MAVDTSGILIHLCEHGHRLKWSSSRKTYRHMEGDQATCDSQCVRVVPKPRS